MSLKYSGEYAQLSLQFSLCEYILLSHYSLGLLSGGGVFFDVIQLLLARSDEIDPSLHFMYCNKKQLDTRE